MQSGPQLFSIITFFSNSRKFSLQLLKKYISQPYESTFKGKVWRNPAQSQKKITQINVPGTQEVALQFGSG